MNGKAISPGGATRSGPLPYGEVHQPMAELVAIPETALRIPVVPATRRIPPSATATASLTTVLEESIQSDVHAWSYLCLARMGRNMH